MPPSAPPSSRPCSPAAGASFAAVGSPTAPSSPRASALSSLNTTASPFSPSGTLASCSVEEPLEWLLYTPSSLEGPSLGLDRTPLPSFSEVIVGKGKGKRVASGAREVIGSSAPRAAPSGFMVAAHRAHPWSPHHPQPQDGRKKQVTHRKQWMQMDCAPTPPPPLSPRRPVPADLVCSCFNCIRPDHIMVDCTFTAHCLRCCREGHQARACKHPRSPEAMGPPIQAQHFLARREVTIGTL
jgi:hypothetical protein